MRLAELVGSDKSQTSRTLATLAEHGLVERDPDTLAYRVGWQSSRWPHAPASRACWPRRPRLLRDARGPSSARAPTSRCARATSVLTLLSESPASAIHAPAVVGSLAPLANTSAGRVLAPSTSPTDELDSARPRRLGAQIAAARELGYAIVREEFEPGLVAAAAPVRDSGGRVVAAVNVSAPAFRFAARLDEAAAAVAAAAAALSADLGAPRAARLTGDDYQVTTLSRAVGNRLFLRAYRERPPCPAASH